MKRTGRYAWWGATIAVIGALYLLEAADAFPAWFLAGPVAVGVAGVALMIDRLAFSSSTRRSRFILPLLLVGVSAGTVLQDADLLVDEYSIWPPLVGGLLVALVLGAVTSHGGSAGGRA
jgi:hypothetical protein